MKCVQAELPSKFPFVFNTTDDVESATTKPLEFMSICDQTFEVSAGSSRLTGFAAIKAGSSSGLLGGGGLPSNRLYSLCIDFHFSRALSNIPDRP